MQERSRTEYSLINIFVGIGGYILNTVLGFVCRMVFVRCLSADYLGVSGLFTNVLTMLSLAELGVGSAVVYALYKPLAEHDEEKIASLVKLYGKAYRTIGLIIAVVGILLMPFLNVIIKEQPDIKESIYLLYIINLFNTSSSYFFCYRSSLLSAAQQNYLVVGVSYVVTIVQSVFQMIWLLLTHDYLGYLLIQTVGTFAYNIAISYIATKKYPYIKNENTKSLPKEERKGLFKNVRDLMIYKVSSLLVNSTDNILITFFKGLATTGIASNYTLLINTLNALLGNIFNGMTASVGNYNALENDEKRYEMFCFLNLMNFWIFGWAALGIIFCSSDIVKLCFGENYVLTPSIPIVMAVNFYIVGMLNAVWTYKNTLGLFRYGKLMQIALGVLNIVLSVILGTIWGLFGILFATTISRVITTTWYDPYAIFKHGFHKSPFLYLKRYCHYLVVLMVAAVCCHFFLRLIDGSLIRKVFLEIVVCSVIVNVIFLAAFHRTTEFRKLKAVVKNAMRIVGRKA